MHLTIGSLLLAMSALSYTLAGRHSMCYKYFLQKDGCVSADKNENKRCENPTRQRNPPHSAVLLQPTKQTDKPLVTVQTTQENENTGDDSEVTTAQAATTNTNTDNDNTQPSKRLVRRYDTEETQSFTIAGGDGICGNYTVDQPGACVWSGPADSDGKDPLLAGWLNGAFNKNCGKQIYITRVLKTGERVTTYAPIVDGCSFNEYKNDTGCFRLAFTNKTFFDLKPTPEEQKATSLEEIDWNWNNEDGKNKTNGPY